MNYGVGAWPCARPVKGDHKGCPYSPTIAQRAEIGWKRLEIED